MSSSETDRVIDLIVSTVRYFLIATIDAGRWSIIDVVESDVVDFNVDVYIDDAVVYVCL